MWRVCNCVELLINAPAWTSRFSTRLLIPTCPYRNPRADLAPGEAGPSVCPRGPGSPAACTLRHCASQMQRVSTKAATAHSEPEFTKTCGWPLIFLRHTPSHQMCHSPHISQSVVFLKWRATMCAFSTQQVLMRALYASSLVPV